MQKWINIMSFENQQSFESLIESYEGKLSDSDKELISIVLGEPPDSV